MKLIDADELVGIIEGNEELADWQKKEFVNCINACDTAYDVDAVVERLEDRKSLMLETFKISESDIDRGRIYGMDKAIEIVKGFIPNDAVWGYTAFTPKGYISYRGTFADGYGEKFFKPPYQPGDILYVRETFIQAAAHTFWYKADDKAWMQKDLLWKPSIHMPKEAARIWLKVTNVRVERLKDMTDNDALKEGAEGVRCNHAGLGPHGCTDCMNTGWLEPPLLEFMGIWNSTIKKSDLDRYGWDANPYVWVISFERCEKPEGV